MRISSILLVASLVTFSPAAFADTAATLTFTGIGVTGTLNLDVSTIPTTSDGFEITGISGDVNGETITGLLPASYDSAMSNSAPNNNIYYDNIFYDNAPHLDYAGVAFYFDGTYGNIYQNEYSPELYFISAADAQNGDLKSGTNPGTLLAYTLTVSNPSATPEPASLLLLGTGALGLAGAARRRCSRK